MQAFARFEQFDPLAQGCDRLFEDLNAFTKRVCAGGWRCAMEIEISEGGAGHSNLAFGVETTPNGIFLT